MTWRRFLLTLLTSFALFAAICYGFILVLDPYQNVPFSPALPRAPVAQNQRYAYPALARDRDFDSAIVGTSMIRLLKPARLDARLDARFVNLAMNSATAYEQVQMNALFLRHHPAPKVMIYALDDSWCRATEEAERYTFREFPEFMFDEKRWNDLRYLFNDKALENAVRMFELLRGRREPKYGSDGYFDFTRDFGAYDLDRTRQRIYGGTIPPAPLPVVDLEPKVEDVPRMANLELLPSLLEAPPPATRVVLLIPPMHVWHVQGNAAGYRECKRQALSIATRRPNILVLDYLLDGPITREDRNYWDAIHYDDFVAERIEREVAAGLAGELRDEPGTVVRRVLVGAAGG
jgi:hypothetical protein